MAEKMQWRADLMAAERFDDLAREYLLPLVLYQGDRQVVLHRHEELVSLFAEACADHRARGITQIEARVAAIDIPRGGRFRVWMRYYQMDAQGRVVSQSDVVHYCRDTPDGLKTEMADYGGCALPDVGTAKSVASAHPA